MQHPRMRLTPELLARVPAASGNYDFEEIMAGRRPAVPEDHARIAGEMLAGAASPDEVWVFAYGSLIWNPCFEFVERRHARAHGWHRDFCLGWDKWFRGSVERPALMLALDRGGSCNGVAFRLPPARARADLVALAAREVHVVPSPFPPRWIDVATAGRRVRALTFTIDRRSGAYVAELPVETLVATLATAAGQLGSMAEYLHNTVAGLEEAGARDRRLWALQDRVAARLEGGAQ